MSGLARVGGASRLYPEHRALHGGLGAVLAAFLGQLGWLAVWSDAVGALRGGGGGPHCGALVPGLRTAMAVRPAWKRPVGPGGDPGP